MGERRLLVIGSQCEGQPKLSFLPELATRFYHAMTEKGQGQCRPALPEERGGGLLLDPTVRQTKDAIREAYRRASADQATLFLAYVGHGEASGDDFYLLPTDAAGPRNMDNAVYLVQIIREEFQESGGVDGLVVLLDACSAGATVPDVAGRWVHAQTKRPLRFELLTATGTNPAYDGCFTRILADLLCDGDAETASKYLRTQDCMTPLAKGCERQQPRLLLSSYGADRGLWLMRNKAFAAAIEPWLRSEISDEIARLTSHYQPPALLAQIPVLLEADRCVAITGPAGAGKSALLAALARPDVTREAIPPGFLHAIVFLTAATTSEEAAGFLAWQLERSVTGFAECLRDFEARTQHAPEWAGLDALHRKVIGPLRLLNRTEPLRIAVDSLDQAPDVSLPVIVAFLQTLATDAALAFVRVVVTARPDVMLPGSANAISLDRAQAYALRAYFTARNVPAGQVEAAIVRADGNWLVADMLADLAGRDPIGFDPTAIPPGLPAVYDRALQEAGAGDRRRWREELRPVLSVLAVAGAGPVLPFALFRRACRELGGPDTNARLRDVLVDLRGFVVRTSPGLEGEHVGVFHATLAEHLLQTGRATSIEAEQGHRALLAAIEELAPANEWDARNPGAEQRYAFRRHAEHLWAVGASDQVVTCLAARKSNVPRENATAWMAGLERCAATLGPDHADTLTMRSHLAAWTGFAGDVREALRLFKELLPDKQRLLGPDDSDTLMTRNNMAFWTGEAGDAQGALRLFKEVLADQVRLLGHDHPDTLTTRHNVAAWTGYVGDTPEALRLFKELLADKQRRLGADHPETLMARNGIAFWTGKAGDAGEALRLFKELLPDQQCLLGQDHTETLITRSNVANWTGQLGDPSEARRLYSELLPDRQRVLGPHHPDTLRTRNNIAFWAGEAGDGAGALRLFNELLPDQQRFLGPDHPETLRTRNNVAFWSAQLGDKGALQLFEELLRVCTEALPPDHQFTALVRKNYDAFREQLGG